MKFGRVLSIHRRQEGRILAEWQRGQRVNKPRRIMATSVQSHTAKGTSTMTKAI